MYKICEIELGLGYLADKKYNYIQFYSENDNLSRLGKVQNLLMYAPEFDAFIGHRRYLLFRRHRHV